MRSSILDRLPLVQIVSLAAAAAQQTPRRIHDFTHALAADDNCYKMFKWYTRMCIAFVSKQFRHICHCVWAHTRPTLHSARSEWLQVASHDVLSRLASTLSAPFPHNERITFHRRFRRHAELALHLHQRNKLF